jgi:hypothetical protein
MILLILIIGALAVLFALNRCGLLFLAKYRVTHLKTGNIYIVLKDDVISSTNGEENIRKVVYLRRGKWYEREYGEFSKKFEKILK